MVHYVPASLENLTEVVKYVMDEDNEEEMKTMVESANAWCAGSLSEEGLARDSIMQLERYEAALDAHGANRSSSWRQEWKRARRKFDDSGVDRLVECNPWNVIDAFTFPVFNGL